MRRFITSFHPRNAAFGLAVAVNVSVVGRDREAEAPLAGWALDDLAV